MAEILYTIRTSQLQLSKWDILDGFPSAKSRTALQPHPYFIMLTKLGQKIYSSYIDNAIDFTLALWYTINYF